MTRHSPSKCVRYFASFMRFSAILPGRGFPFEGLEVRHPPLEALAA
jgi:hypothetical protein